MSTTIEQLELEVQSNSTSAVSGIEALASSLGKLKTATKGGVGLTAVAKQLSTLNTALGSISNANIGKLGNLNRALQTLSSLGKIKVSSSIASQITNLGGAVRGLGGTDFSVLNKLANSLVPLTAVGKANLNSFISQLTRLPQAVQALNSVNMGGLNSKLAELVSALSQLSNMGKNNLTSFVTQLNKIPKLMENLKNVDMRTLYNQIQSLVRVFTPLATQMEKVSAGFAAFPSRIQKLIQTTDNLSASNNRASKSYVNLAAKLGTAWITMRKVAELMADWINQAVQWEGIFQRFSRAFGESAEENYQWIKRLNKELGINTQLFMQYSSIYGTMLTGYGVAQKDAATMAMGYAELTYDIWAGFNDVYKSYEDAAIAVRSAIAGEVEPIRKAGFTIVDSQLKATAAMYGIEYSTQSATEELKSYLRYLTLVNQAYDQNLVGTYVREMNTAEGVLRTLRQELYSLAQTFGSIFLPILAKVIPYVQAFVSLIKDAIVALASLFGIKIQPVDFSQSFDKAETATGGIKDNLGGAAKKAKEVKNALLGIDELNVISPPDNSGNGSTTGGVGGGGYEGVFDIGKLWDESIFKEVQNQVDEIKKKIKEMLPTILAIAAGFAAWKLVKGLLSGIASLKKMLEALGSSTSVPLVFIGLLNFLSDLDKFKKYVEDFMKNGATFENVAGMISQFAGMLGDAFIILGQTKIGGVLQIVDGIGTILAEISDWRKNGADLESALGIVDGLSEIAIGIGFFTGKINVVGWGMVLQGFTTIITELSENWEAIKQGDWNGVDKVTLIIGGLEALGGLVVALDVFSKIKGVVESKKAVDTVKTVTTTTADLDTTVSTKLSPNLTSLVKNIGMGVLILGEVAAGAVIFAGAIAVVGWELGKAADAWQPVIENAGTVAIAIGVGTGLLAGVGGATYALGSVGKTAAINIGIGTAILVELGVAAGLFIVEIWAIGKGLDEIGKAWQPVINNGETIATGIGIGTGLLVGIGVVTAALGAATVASAGLLPVAIGLGTAVLVELSAAFILFNESLVDVADELNYRLSPSLRGLNEKLPTLTSDMSSFVDFMGDFAGEVVDYTKHSAIAGLSATIDTIVGWFTADPIDKLASDVEDISDQTSDLNEKLRVAVPELQTAIDLLRKYKGFLSEMESLTNSNVNLSAGMFVNMKEVGQKLVTGFVDGIKSKSSDFSNAGKELVNGFKTSVTSSAETCKSTMIAWASNVKNWFTQSSFGGINRVTFQNYGKDITSGFNTGVSSSYPSSRSSVTAWASNIKQWFTGNGFGAINRNTFLNYAKEIVNGFGNGISQSSNASKTSMVTWATNVKNWFSESASRSVFYNIARDVVSGFNSGINDLYDTSRRYMKKWANDAISAFKQELDSHSPSRVFEGIAGDTVLGYNLGIANVGKSTNGVIADWVNSFTSVSPVMSFAVDTSALRYYSSDSFAKTVSADVTTNRNYSVTGFKEGMEEFYREYVEPTLSQMAEDVRRQADKNEQTIVQIGNRTVSDAVTTQRKANGYVFVK